MPRGNRERLTWLYISDGKVREKVKQDHPDAQYRKVVMDDKTYELYEIVNDYIEGYITDIQVETGEFGRRLEIYMNDGEEKFVVRMRWDSLYAGSFLQKAPNINFNEAVILNPYYFEKDKKARLTIIQGANKVGSYNTKEDPKGMPEFPETDNEDDLKQWKVDISKFLHKQLIDIVFPKLREASLPPGIVEPEADIDISDDDEINPFEESDTISKEHREENREKARDEITSQSDDPGPTEDDLPF